MKVEYYKSKVTSRKYLIVYKEYAFPFYLDADGLFTWRPPTVSWKDRFKLMELHEEGVQLLYWTLVSEIEANEIKNSFGVDFMSDGEKVLFRELIAGAKELCLVGG